MLRHPEADLLPDLNEIQQVSKTIAFKVAKAAMEAGVAPLINDELLTQAIEANFWKPSYRDYKRVTF
jgi:malate dehydrogenase (oxaloacetate-decarboxylating)